MKNLTHLYVKLYSLLILNKILLKLIILYCYYHYSFLIKNYEDVNIIMFLTYTKIIYFYKRYNF